MTKYVPRRSERANCVTRTSLSRCVVVAMLFGMLCAFAQAEQAMSQHDPARLARDAKYEENVRELGGSGITVLSYEDLLTVVRGYPVTVLGGYSGLDYEHPGKLRAQIVNLVQRNGDKSI